MANLDRTKEWISIAEEDLKAADILSKNMWPIPSEIIGFHCQQAAEKHLKAFLVFHDQEPPKIHNLVELINLCGNIDARYSTLLFMGEFLTPFATQSRYPGRLDAGEQDMNRALAYAKDIIAFVKSTLPEIFTAQKTGDTPNA